ncbi:MAG: DUF4168 domain-containing protein [Bacteroidales bacterium]
MLVKKATSIVLFFLFAGFSALAQQPQPVDASKAEIKQFAQAFMDVQTINNQSQQEMIQAIQKEGMEVPRFNEIQQASQDPNMEADASEEEMNTFEKISSALASIQEKVQIQMEEKIVESGLTIKRYQKIAMSLQNDQDLQERVQQELQKLQQNQQQ